MAKIAKTGPPGAVASLTAGKDAHSASLVADRRHNNTAKTSGEKHAQPATSTTLPSNRSGARHPVFRFPRWLPISPTRDGQSVWLTNKGAVTGAGTAEGCRPLTGRLGVQGPRARWCPPRAQAPGKTPLPTPPLPHSRSSPVGQRE
ncbi:uncharacterized protein THITE_2091489 [Thermothielavioides terrestris NRRL 8126]|uniref:Uncharacterized protein n=1 Tax=Thermothielavioides terrestris (strain ATCC 38088 / NRRL 8126) TaxID=578455 RepID=G2RDQ5_THETT|nr:uncharacterized protein THITE_2091489 [Thermothielavioides terrestris NRRL 8126]AEO69986.1 hypothetical protein THITE_2091489 [Thermothielavioides terrestris NRRL 8126]